MVDISIFKKSESVISCLICDMWGKYWVVDPTTGQKEWKNWDKNWVGCKLEKTPDKCPKNAKLDVKA